jgi:hypothetical protein
MDLVGHVVMFSYISPIISGDVTFLDFKCGELQESF